MNANRIAAAIGKGIIAGIAGTAAITLSQMIEMKITGRKPSDGPAKIGGKVLGVRPKDQQTKRRFNNLMHWGYGSSWGVFLAACEIAGVNPTLSSFAHFTALWGTALTMLPMNNLSEPITEWEPKDIAVDMMHHAVYTIAAGLVFHQLLSEKEDDSSYDWSGVSNGTNQFEETVRIIRPQEATETNKPVGIY